MSSFSPHNILYKVHYQTYYGEVMGEERESERKKSSGQRVKTESRSS